MSAERLVDSCRAVAEAGLSPGSSGNASMREGDTVYITTELNALLAIDRDTLSQRWRYADMADGDFTPNSGMVNFTGLEVLRILRPLSPIDQVPGGHNRRAVEYPAVLDQAVTMQQSQRAPTLVGPATGRRRSCAS